MDKLSLNRIREEYLKFFEKKEHLRMSSFSLVPVNDPSILLINAGMTPLKPYFTGEEKPPAKRVTTCQKCMRTPDIERVGITSRHGTFFEMLGNFSFGDYFKKEAIPWAWEFFTEVMKIPEDKLWVSIYNDDDEAFEIWNKDIGLAPERIVRLGKEDNFWEHGTGPCGPCSEIHYDRGEIYSCGKSDCKVGCDCDRYMEIWNLVFTQFNKTEDGEYIPLEKKNIDTGMGLERLACVMQGVDSLFEVDTIRNVLDYVCETAKYEYGTDKKKDISIRVITDHIRSTMFMVSDGIMPSNEGRGYVLRRILRRAARHGKLMGISKTFLADVAVRAIRESKEAYPELSERKDYILKVISIEEERFYKTLDQGLDILNGYLEEIEKSNSKMITGDKVFKLHDTYGFPIDLTREIAAEWNLEIDEEGFTKEMNIQKETAREALKKKEGSAWSDSVFKALQNEKDTVYVNESPVRGSIKYILNQDDFSDYLEEGQEGIIITDTTSFYAESGGQTGDTGEIKSDNGLFEVNNCIKSPDGKFYLHKGTVKKGLMEKGERVTLGINKKRREAIERNHTATHLLQSALRNVLGDHVNQAGSYVGDDRLRFDFTHFNALTKDELEKVEEMVNTCIYAGTDIDVMEDISIDEAKKLGATALFGEKYGEKVRIVKMGDISMELCGGSHLDNTLKTGMIKILGESGIAAGVRRIEAITGPAAIEYLNNSDKVLHDLQSILKTDTGELKNKIESIIRNNKEKDKLIKELKNKLAGDELESIVESACEVDGIKIITGRFDDMDKTGLRDIADRIKDRVDSAIVVLASGNSGTVNLLATTAKGIKDRGLHSGNIIREVAKITGGGGGGRPDMAQAGGKDASKLDEALAFAVKHIKELIEKG
jgi:alanyl-tRNA synthetase